MQLVKKILLVIFIALSFFTSFGQGKPSGFPITKSTGWIQYGYIQNDSGRIDAVRDTNWLPSKIPTTVFWINPGVDSAFWTYKKTTGKRWYKEGGGSGGSGTDSSIRKGYGIIIDISGTNRTISVDSLQFATKLRVQHVADSLAALSWLLSGNYGTDPEEQAIGTKDETNLRFIVGNLKAGYIDYANNNTSFGVYALKDIGLSTTAAKNTALGKSALFSMTEGLDNIGIGFEPRFYDVRGERNIVIGSGASERDTSSNDNIIIGYTAGTTDGSFFSSNSNVIAIGSSAAWNNTLSNTIHIDNGSANGDTTVENIYINSNINEGYWNQSLNIRDSAKIGMHRISADSDSAYTKDPITGKISYAKINGGGSSTNVDSTIRLPITFTTPSIIQGTSHFAGTIPGANYAPVKLASDILGFTVVNQAVAGSSLMSIMETTYRGHQQFRRDSARFVESGWNDANNDYNANTAMRYYNVMKSTVTDQFLDTAIAANSASLSKVGTWSTYNTYTNAYGKAPFLTGGAGLGQTTSTVSDSIIWVTPTSTSVVIQGIGDYSTNLGSYTIWIDGVFKDTVNCQNQTTDRSSVFDPFAVTKVPLVKVYDNLSNTTHTVVIKNISGTIIIDYVGTLRPNWEDQKPIYLCATLRSQAKGFSQQIIGGGNSVIEEMNKMGRQVVKEFKALNPNNKVFFIDINKSVDYDKDFYTDGVHLTSLGTKKQANDIVNFITSPLSKYNAIDIPYLNYVATNDYPPLAGIQLQQPTTTGQDNIGTIRMGNDIFLRWYAGNIGLGKGAWNSNSTAINSIAIGDGSQGTGLQTVGYNYTLGGQAGLSLTSGTKNFFGNFQTGLAANSASDNNIIGYRAFVNATDATDNNGFGTQGLLTNVHGSRNTFFGTNSLVFNEGSDNFTGGYFSGFNALTTDGSIYIGNKTAYNATSADYSIAIGTGVDLPSATTAGQLNIGNLIYGNNLYQSLTPSSTPVTGGRIGIGNSTPTALLHLAAGTATAGTAPIKLNTGTALTTPEDGAIEYHGSHIYFTIGSTRYQLDQQVNADSVTTKWSTLGNTLTGTGKFGSLSNHGFNFVTNDAVRGGFTSAGAFSTTQDVIFNGIYFGQGPVNGLSHIRIGGANTLRDVTAGSLLNTALGIDALKQTTTGDFNLAIGYTALEKNTTGSDQNAFGRQAGQNNVGDKTVFLGGAAGVNCLSCDYNIQIENSNGSGNAISTGDYNIIIGNRIGNLSPSLHRSIVISDSTTIWLLKDSSGVTTITGGDFRYAANYAANYTARSFVDKNYVDSSLLAGSGTYTPTLTNVANVAASTAYSCQYSRVGTVVTVSGEVDIDPTTTLTLTQLGISLPIASNLTATNELGGTSADDLNTAARVAGDATNNRAEIRMTPVDVTNRRFSFTFTYRVL